MPPPAPNVVALLRLGAQVPGTRPVPLVGESDVAFGQDLEEEFGSASVEFHIAEFVDEQVDAAVAGDGLGQLLFVSGFDPR